MEAINITAYTTDITQIQAIKAVLKALKIKFEVAKEKPYNKEFVAKIEQGRKDFREGKGVVMTMEQLNDLWK